MPVSERGSGAALRAGIFAARGKFDLTGDRRELGKLRDKPGLWNCTKLEGAILAYGILLRLAQYLHNRSLWLDEATLALNIVNRSLAQLLKPLDFHQGAPVGFLMLQKLAVHVFGNSEYALRLFPFLFGTFSLLLFYVLAKVSISPRAVPIALGLFATSAPLIYYSSEVKQYSGDAMIAILLSLAAIEYSSGRLNAGRMAAFGLLGAVALCFSFPSVFVLAGIGLSLLLFCPSEERWTRIRTFSIPFSLWAITLIVIYVLFLRKLNADPFLMSFWGFAFPPSRLFSVAAAQWFVNTFFGVFQDPVGLELSGIAAFTFLVGCFRWGSTQRQNFSILTSPILVALLAAILHRYPFGERLLLFAVPALLLVIAEGVEGIRCNTSTGVPFISACLIGILFFQPLVSSSYHLLKPRGREEIRPVLEYLEAKAREGDVLYIYPRALAAFQYYAPRVHLPNLRIVEGTYAERENWGDYKRDERDLDRLHGQRRAWFLFSQGNNSIGLNDEKLFLYFLEKRGTKIDYFQSVGATIYLYDLDRRSEPLPETGDLR